MMDGRDVEDDGWKRDDAFVDMESHAMNGIACVIIVCVSFSCSTSMCHCIVHQSRLLLILTSRHGGISSCISCVDSA